MRWVMKTLRSPVARSAAIRAKSLLRAVGLKPSVRSSTPSGGTVFTRLPAWS